MNPYVKLAFAVLVFVFAATNGIWNDSGLGAFSIGVLGGFIAGHFGMEAYYEIQDQKDYR